MTAENYTRNFSPIIAEIKSESDRACAIIARAITEEKLRELLTSNFHSELTSKEVEELFNGLAPLSTFGARIKMSYALGLITKDEVTTFNFIKKVGNKFAHSSGVGLSIDHFQQQINLIPLLRNHQDFIAAELKKELDEETLNLIQKADKFLRTNRGKFEYIFAMSHMNLSMRMETLQPNKTAKIIFP